MTQTPVLSALTVPKLKERCRELGIPVGGKKADLIARIEARLSAADKVTLATSSAQISQSSGAHVLIIPGTTIRTSKATTKRKTIAENASYLPNEAPIFRRKKRPKSTEVPVIISGSAQQFPPEAEVCSLSSDLHSSTPQSWKATTGEESTFTRVQSPASRPVSTVITTTTLHPHIRAVQKLNLITGSSIRSSIIPPQSSVPPQIPSRAVVPTQSTTLQIGQEPETLNVTFQGNSAAVIKGSSKSLKTRPTKNDLLPANQQKREITFTPSIADERRESAKVPELFTEDRPSLGGLTVSPPRLQARNPGTKNDGTGIVTPRVIETFRGEIGEYAFWRITESMVKVDPSPSLGLFTETLPRVINSAKTRGRSFKRLEPNIKGNKAVSPGTESSILNYPSTITTTLPPHKQDSEVSPSIICNPPKYSLRRQVENIARILALVAFHSFYPHSRTSAPGDFLRRFAGLSRNYRYASTLAFTHLVKLEFPGKRTQQWFQNKRIDEMVTDVRLWYWHRVSERAKVIERVRTSWMERVWRFLVWASIPAIPTPDVDKSLGRFELWFNGIDQHLLAEPDLDGQFETAVRFWIRRFYVWVTKNGGGYPLLLQDLQDEMVLKIQPLNEIENGDLWRVETKCGSVHFIVGLTGEVVGWVGVDGKVGEGLDPVRQRRLKTRIGTIIRQSTEVRTHNRAFTVISPENYRNKINTEDITWQDLREDWREHASNLVSSSLPLDKATSPQSLIKLVYRPNSKSFSNGIHESVKLPHHRALAERWILAQVEAGGISGRPVLEVTHGQARSRGRLALDLQAKFTVESVRCAGERWISSMKGVLAQGLGFVQTPGMGWFVLEETGQNIAQEEYGIQGLWATVLGVRENGVLLDVGDLEGLADMFVWEK